jgi:hypothetical protein
MLASYYLCPEKDGRFDTVMLVSPSKMRIFKCHLNIKAPYIKILQSMNTLNDLTCPEPVQILTFSRSQIGHIQGVLRCSQF